MLEISKSLHPAVYSYRDHIQSYPADVANSSSNSSLRCVTRLKEYSDCTRCAIANNFSFRSLRSSTCPFYVDKTQRNTIIHYDSKQLQNGIILSKTICKDDTID